MLNSEDNPVPSSLLIRLPDDVVSRFRSLIPARQRNKFLADLVAKAVADQESDLEKIAAAVTLEESNDRELQQELADWQQTNADGLDDAHDPA